VVANRIPSALSCPSGLPSLSVGTFRSPSQAFSKAWAGSSPAVVSASKEAMIWEAMPVLARAWLDMNPLRFLLVVSFEATSSCVWRRKVKRKTQRAAASSFETLCRNSSTPMKGHWRKPGEGTLIWTRLLMSMEMVLMLLFTVGSNAGEGEMSESGTCKPLSHQEDAAPGAAVAATGSPLPHTRRTQRPVQLSLRPDHRSLTQGGRSARGSCRCDRITPSPSQGGRSARGSCHPVTISIPLYI